MRETKAAPVGPFAWEDSLMEQLHFREPWQPTHGDPIEQDRLHRQLQHELEEGHPLHGHDVEVIARDTASDDIVVRLDDGRFAMVSLFEPRPSVTSRWWRRGAVHQHGGPDVKLYDEPQQLRAALEAHYRLWDVPPDK